MGYFDKGQLQADPSRPALRPPPDYTRRNIKVRIFVLVAVLMLVLSIAERARDPQTWKWLTDLDRQAESDTAPHNNRLTPPPTRTAGDSLDTFIASSDNSAAKATPASTDESPASQEPKVRAWSQGWKDVYQLLEYPERTLLYELLYAAREQQPFPTDQREAAEAVLTKLDTQWKEYQVAAFQSIVDLAGEDQKLWTDVLRHVNERWTAQVHSALKALIVGEELSPEQRQVLADWQQTLDEVNLKLVQDDRVFVPGDREILFRLLGEVRDTPPAELRQKSLDDITYLQLFKQSPHYRGQVVTVRGTVKLAYHVAAPTNHLGIEGYYVYWIHPNDGPNAPIVVYALETPAGFPPIKDRDADGATTTLHENVEVTGYFLKRWAYRGKDGTRTAPLILARAPAWDAEMSKLARSAGRTELTSNEIYTAIAVAFGLSLLAFGFIYYFVRRRELTLRPEPNSAEEAAAIAALQDVKLTPTTAEALQQLSREAQAQDDQSPRG